MSWPSRVLLVGLALVLAACSFESDGGLEAGAGEPAPEFSLELLDGGGRVSLAELRGQTVILDFWATWCPPCEFQVPELNALYEAHRELGDIRLFGVSVDTDGPEVIGAWVAEKQVRYPILLGDEDLARRFGALGFPTLIVIGPDGKVVSRHMGLVETGDIEASLEKIATAS
ncbi:MAG: TlpA family protein disulfide reductase [Deltaproteobacteria bacterium]|nr:TlpA family protein disulfide reductase [Deltaproteobacteria bacterium]MBW2419884.1 TlpA family protein disulfide reductase [Deltaproteobacteria bacterium]